jgi:hypothetical protein
MIAIAKMIYGMIPKWLLMILVAALLVCSAWLWVKAQYLQVDNKRLANDNAILSDNAKILQGKLDTCEKSLKAEADNADRAEVITKETQIFKDRIVNICVKEGADEKTDIGDAIKLSNDLSERFNAGMRDADKDHSK